jgi:protein-L-isoaspartate(D-aspartate) O-methyltransferase
MTALQARQRMVDDLQTRGIHDLRILKALREVPREEFVLPEFAGSAYDDSALPLSHRQTISQPLTVAFMLQALELQGTESGLEIGTGSGYGAAVLSRVIRQVATIERIPELACAARQRLKRLGFHTVQVFEGDGTQGLPDQAPYDVICITAAARVVPPACLQQLREGGRLILPLQVAGESHQEMTRITRQGTRFSRQTLGTFRFVPLIGDY